MAASLFDATKRGRRFGKLGKEVTRHFLKYSEPTGPQWETTFYHPNGAGCHALERNRMAT
jgi:hypothetical protein